VGDLNLGVNIEITDVTGPEDRSEGKAPVMGNSNLRDLPLPSPGPIIPGVGWVVVLFVFITAVVALMVSR